MFSCPNCGKPVEWGLTNNGEWTYLNIRRFRHVCKPKPKSQFMELVKKLLLGK